MKRKKICVNQPCSGRTKYEDWAREAGFSVVRCCECGLLFVNPRPNSDYIDAAIRSGQHPLPTGIINCRARRVARKVGHYKKIFQELFEKFWDSRKPVVWVDIGSGYGEILEAVSMLAARDSILVGIEPMEHKAKLAQKAGVTIHNGYLAPSQFQASIISIVNVFSHIPNFHSFLKIVSSNLAPDGELFLETGNLADLGTRSEFPGELGLPDHLVFAGEKQMIKYLNEAGFEILDIRYDRVDGCTTLAKNSAKIISGRPCKMRVPYRSKYRQLLFRAKLKG